MSWRDWFEKAGTIRYPAISLRGEVLCQTKELKSSEEEQRYQAFKARLLEEVQEQIKKTDPWQPADLEGRN